MLGFLLILCGLWMCVASISAYTAQFHAGAGLVNGKSSDAISEVSDGAGVVMPTPTLADCEGWEFAGWTESDSALATDSTGLPKRLFLKGEVYYPTRNETLNAVYRRKSTNWEQVEDLSTLQAGEKIIIAYFARA